MKLSRTYLVILAASMIWCGMILTAPLMQVRHQPSPTANEIYRFYGKVCHQLDSRSLHLGGEKLAVCARCSGIYFSFLIMLIVYPFVQSARIRDTRLWVLAALTPMLVDVALDVLGIHESTIATRLITGTLFGFPICLILAPDLVSGIHSLFLKFKTIIRLRYATKTR